MWIIIDCGRIPFSNGEKNERTINARYKEKVIEKLTYAFSDSVKTSKHLLDEQLKEYFTKLADLVSECCQKENMVQYLTESDCTDLCILK